MNAPTLFITGATGFLGGMVLTRLLETRADCRLLLLARAASVSEAGARLRRSVARFLEAGLPEAAWQRCEIIVGDLATDDPRVSAATHVLHLAANTSFRSTRAVEETNVQGTLALARRLRAAKHLKRFVHVSTAYLCGADAPRVVHEEDYPRSGVRHCVLYTETKAEAETRLREEASALPLVVARPSAVVGHTRLGCGPSASLYWYYRALFLLRRIPFSPTAWRDVVPVDYVADALLSLLFKANLQYPCYHISAGESSARNWPSIAAAFANCYADHVQEGFRQIDVEALGREWDRIAPRLGPGDARRLLTALQLIWPISASGVEVFDNGRLRAEGLPPPPAFPTYLERCASLPPHRTVCQQMTDDE